ncbi:MAG: hypothetical protein KA139_11185, partial [Rhodobacteraceae bacterium]|nr:hypothetical protein [Paracoccaceae bacterium]
MAMVWLAGPGPALADDLIPDRRLVLSENTDLPGGDLTSIFDTTLEACERACLTNRACTAFTFNTRNGSCFPKSGAGGPATYQGAYSGTVIEGGAAAEALAVKRAAELTFVGSWEFPGFTAQATNLANAHVTNGYTADEHLAA